MPHLLFSLLPYEYDIASSGALNGVSDFVLWFLFEADTTCTQRPSTTFPIFYSQTDGSFRFFLIPELNSARVLLIGLMAGKTSVSS